MSLYLELVPAAEGGDPGDALADLTARARRAEQAGFDAVGFPLPVAGGWPLEPTTVLPALAVRTSTIGLVADVSPAYAAPYNVARHLATLDHISRGRAGWRLVSVDPEGLDGLHGVDAPTPARRGARAEEYAQLLPRLWDSWDDDAIPADRETGVYVDESKIRPTRWTGAEFRVEGPLNVPRTPQGHPVLFVEVCGGATSRGATSGGGSAVGEARGVDLAARHADVASLAVGTVAQARELLPRLRSAGRAPRAVLTLGAPGTPVLPVDPVEAARLLADLAEEGFGGFRLVLDRAGLDRVADALLPELARLGHPRPGAPATPRPSHPASASEEPSSGGAPAWERVGRAGTTTLRDRLGLPRPADRSGEGVAA